MNTSLFDIAVGVQVSTFHSFSLALCKQHRSVLEAEGGLHLTKHFIIVTGASNAQSAWGLGIYGIKRGAGRAWPGLGWHHYILLVHFRSQLYYMQHMQ